MLYGAASLAFGLLVSQQAHREQAAGAVRRGRSCCLLRPRAEALLLQQLRARASKESV